MSYRFVNMLLAATCVILMGLHYDAKTQLKNARAMNAAYYECGFIIGGQEGELGFAEHDADKAMIIRWREKYVQECKDTMYAPPYRSWNGPVHDPLHKRDKERGYYK